MRSVWRVRSAALAAAAIFVLRPLASGQDAQPPKPQASFRTAITMVPVDVRVIDRNGKPVTDLTERDFTITEDGVAQTIRHFSTQALVAEPPAPGQRTQPALRTAASPDLAPQRRRVFLLMLGRGRMQGPSKETAGLLEFVRTKLLPQDQVALMAYNRATDFTTDHARLVTVVERFQAANPTIEQALSQWFSGLRAIYGASEIPRHIQSMIDALFEGAVALRPREIRPGQITDRGRITADQRRNADNLQRAEILATREPGSFLPDPEATTTSEEMDVSLDEYVSGQSELMQDVGNLYAGIDYMRHLEGEKHLVMITPRGLLLPRVENDRSIGNAASDARVAVDIIHTGGVVGAPPPRFVDTLNGPVLRMSPLPTTAAVFGQTFTVQAQRTIAEMTGGQSSAFQSTSHALSRLDAATRFQYLLGYDPTNTTWNGRIRKIAVKVNRPGVTVVYRRSYYGTRQLVPLDRREFLTHNRILAAGTYTGEIKDIEVTLMPPVVGGTGATSEIAVEMMVRSPRILFGTVEGLRQTTLDIGVYCGDAKRLIVCETLKRVDITLNDERYRQFINQGVKVSTTLTLTGKPAYVKAIVYNYAADLLGSATVKVK